MFPQVSPKASSRQCMYAKPGEQSPTKLPVIGRARGFRKHLGYVVASAVKDRWGVQGRREQRQEASLAPPPPCTVSHPTIPTYRRVTGEVCSGRVNHLPFMAGILWDSFTIASRRPFGMF